MRGALYELAFLSSLAASILTFFNGTYATSIGVSDASLGLIFGFTALVSLGSFIFLPKCTQRISLRSILTLATTIFTLGLLLNVFFDSITSFVISLTLQNASYGIMLSVLDMYVERGVDGAHREGDVRGLYLGFANSAYIVGPFLGGLLINMGGFPALFLGACAAIIPFFAIVFQRLPVAPARHTAGHLNQTVRTFISVIKNPHLSTVFSVYLILRMFFSIVGIYTAVYLVLYMGMTYWQAGLVIAVSLIPMVIFEIPVGRLLDRRWNHATVGFAGFVILSCTLGLIPYLNTSDLLPWMFLLFCMRIGAALVEIVAETYFFHHIGISNAEAVSVFRAMFPVSSMLAPIAATIVLITCGFTCLFAATAVLMLFGAYLSTKLTERVK
jgi:MFS family permease